MNQLRTLRVTVSSLEEMRSFAKKWLRGILKLRQSLDQLLVGLIGELGAGKTTLLKLAIGEEVVLSPTFVLLHIYVTSEFTAYHWDLYRLNGDPEEIISQLEELDFFQYLSDPSGVTFVEWFDKVEPSRELREIPTLITHLTYGSGEEEREILIKLRNIPEREGSDFFRGITLSEEGST